MALALSLLYVTPEKYSAFIEALRARLTDGRPTSHGIPVLPRREDVPDDQRFLFVDLTNYNGDTISVAIDVVNVYVAGYCSGNKSYILKDNAENRARTQILFPTAPSATQSTPIQLPFTGDYGELGGYARRIAQPSAARYPGSHSHERIPTLELIPLGRNELDNAITMLHYAASRSDQASSDQAAAFIVIIQMVSEAARFRYIENQVRTRMDENYCPYIPDPAMRSLENNWSALSEQIQNVPANGSRFNRPIQLTNIRNSPHVVDSVEADIVQRRGIAILLYSRQVPTLDRQCCETAGHRHVHDEL
ncbi:ribosome-inactivating protein bryodin II-like [Pyrus communis]|uniref:ribosome-inactivating protein bryodin II-like n=1 Tax=Pyrus communis TaxID=23211 RepID=UPI0035C0C87C